MNVATVKVQFLTMTKYDSPCLKIVEVIKDDNAVDRVKKVYDGTEFLFPNKKFLIAPPLVKQKMYNAKIIVETFEKNGEEIDYMSEVKLTSCE